jgi:tRNA(Ser,Leu) C12 N-acetylase TAN1
MERSYKSRIYTERDVENKLVDKVAKENNLKDPNMVKKVRH